MSYELYLKSKKTVFKKASLETYFNGRMHYSISDDSASYHNKNTGVNFRIDYDSVDSDGDDDEYPILFNMGYFLPSYFGREAAKELAEFVAVFDLTVDDPQVDGMGTGAYNKEKFLSGWLTGNNLAITCLPGRIKNALKLPKDQLTYVWEWNYERANLLETSEKDIVIPIIMVMDYDGQAITSCLWQQETMTMLPKVDYVLMGDDILYLEEDYDFEQGGVSLVKWTDLEPHLMNYQCEKEGKDCYIYQEDDIDTLTTVDFDYIERKPLYEVFEK